MSDTSPVSLICCDVVGAAAVTVLVYLVVSHFEDDHMGAVVALSILRELGPVLTAILVGGKVASGITAERVLPVVASALTLPAWI